MFLMSVVRLACAALAWGAAPALVQAQTETHSSLQAVTATGASAWNSAFPFTIRGVLLCNPDEMVDSTPNYLPWNDGANQYRMGGEWQITFQAVDAGDRGGTTCWMGQNYGNQPWIHNGDLSYTNRAWVSEILRLNYAPSTLHAFRAGDLIEITVRQSLFYGGKRNINEGHDIDPAYNFDMGLVKADYGLPTPEVITLANVMQPGGSSEDRTTWPAIFDQSRSTGAEHYQGMRVRLNNLALVNTNGWNSTNLWGNRVCTVTDGENRFFSLRHPRYSLGFAPTNQFDAIGIFSQESGSGAQGTNGYELFVQQVLPHSTVPKLAIGLNTVVTWPVASDSYLLESRNQVDTGAWSPVTNAPVLFNGMNTVILPLTDTQQFYQLKKMN
jgi:hypothetical protein